MWKNLQIVSVSKPDSDRNHPNAVTIITRDDERRKKSHQGYQVNGVLIQGGWVTGSNQMREANIWKKQGGKWTIVGLCDYTIPIKGEKLVIKPKK
jgi:hypothetical protein